MLVIFFVSLLIPSLSIVRSVEAAPASMYTWTQPTIITDSNGNSYVQTNIDDKGNQLVLTSGEMVLEEAGNSTQACSNSNIDGGNAFNALTPPLEVTTGGTGVNHTDAIFGKSNVLIIQSSYQTATSASLVEFQVPPAGDCADPINSTVNLQATYTSVFDSAQWTSDSPVPVMSYLGSAFTETNVNNGTMTLTGRSIPNINLCTAPTLSVGDTTNSFLTATSATLTLDVLLPGRSIGSCKTSTQTIPIASNYLSTESIANWVDGSNTDPGAQIQISNVGSGDLSIINSGDTYVEPQTGQPAITGSTMILNGGINTAGTCSNNTNENQMQVNPYQTAEIATVTVYHAGTHACIPVKITVGLTNLYGGGTPPGTPTGTNPVASNDGCNVPTSNEPLRWIECPIISSLQGAATSVNGFIGSLLEVSPTVFFNDGTQRAFNIFRDMGVALLVIAGLVMVVSQAADLEIFSAHTVRKALPRIIIAAILISLSWPLLQFVIGFFNDMGAWTGKVILSVANAVPGTGGIGTAWANIGDGLILALVTAGAIVFLGAPGIILLIISALLLAFVAVIVLMIRQVVILICILMAPLAIASYVLPGTEKIGRFWKDTLIAALVMFPLIEGFLSGGAALAFIILSVKSGSFFYQILALVVFIAPYMMVPLTFRIAGGLVGRIADFAQGTHRQTIESKLQAQRQGIVAKNWNAFRAGSRYNPNSSWTRFTGGSAVNFLGRHVGAGPRGWLGIGATGRAAMANNMALSADAASKMNSNFAAQMNNEEAMAAVAFGNNRAALSKLTYFNATALAASGSSSRENIRQTILRRTPGLAGAALDVAINTEAQNMASNRLNSALAAGRTIQATQQMQTAAADALVRSGKVLENRSDFNTMIDSISHGNGSLAAAQKGALQYTARQIGREDIGRSDDYHSLKEMDMSAVIRQKPKSLENLFGGSAIIDAIDSAKSKPDEQQHFADILFAAQNNQSLSPEQQAQIVKAVNTVKAHPTYGSGSTNDLMDKAAKNYRDKFSPGGPTPSDRRLKRDIQYVRTLSNGIKLYSFQYIWGGPQYIGVMAQDLLHSHPEAVSIDLDGYYRVDYALLGIQMLELD